MDQAIIHGLRRGKLFVPLGAEKLAQIAEQGRVEELQEGDLLVEELQPNVSLFMILNGRFEVFLPHTPERFTKLLVATLGPGDCIGEYSFIDKQPASASVVALEPSRVLVIAHEDFERLLRSDSVIGHAVYENLLRLLIGRLRQEIHSLDLFRPA